MQFNGSEKTVMRYVAFPSKSDKEVADDSVSRMSLSALPPKLWLCEHFKCKLTRFESSLFCKQMKNCPKAPLSDNDGCPCLLAFPDICDYCGLHDCVVSKVFHLIKKYSEEDTFVSPDFIVHRNGQMYFVEVKTDSGTFTNSQINFLKEVKNIGIGSFILRVDLDINYKITKKEL